MFIPRCVLLLIFLLLLLLHSSLGCLDPHCLPSTRTSSLQNRVNSLTHANFTSSRPARVRKLATFAQNMASLLKESTTERSDRQLHDSKSVLAGDDSKENNVQASSASSGASNNESPDVTHFPMPTSSSSTFKVLKTADGLAPLLALLGSSASTTKGLVAGTILAKMAKKFLEDKGSSPSPSTFSRRNMRITRRTGRSYLDTEAIILFILGLGIGSVMGLGSVLIPLGLYGGYGAATIPINTQVTGRRRRRDLGRQGNDSLSAASSQENLQRIGRLLTKAIERYSTAATR